MQVWTWDEMTTEWDSVDINAGLDTSADEIVKLVDEKMADPSELPLGPDDYNDGYMWGPATDDIKVLGGRVVVMEADRGAVALNILGANSELEAEDLAKAAGVWPKGDL